jgi:integrase
MTAATVRVPGIFSEDLPSGSARVGFRAPGGRKVQRTFDYRYEGEAWAEAARATVVLGVKAGRDLDDLIAEVTGRPEAEEAAPTATAPSTPTLSSYALSWLDARRGSVEPATSDNYSTHVRLGILTDPIGSRPIDEITRTEVEAWRTRQGDAGAKAPTLNARLKTLRQILRFALDDRLIASDPTSSVRKRPVTVKAKPVLSFDDEARLLAECEDSRDRLLVRVCLEAGLRSGEAFGLTPSALENHGGQEFLSIRQVKVRKGNRIKGYTKDGKSRQVPIADDVAAEFRAVVEAERIGADALVFPKSYDAYRHHWKGITSRAGLNTYRNRSTGREAVRFGLHSLRHTYASRLAAAGAAPVEIMTALGHKDLSTTEIYVHPATHGRRHTLIVDALARARADDVDATVIRLPVEVEDAIA